MGDRSELSIYHKKKFKKLDLPMHVNQVPIHLMTQSLIKSKDIWIMDKT
jgi:hypothetical protein